MIVFFFFSSGATSSIESVRVQWKVEIVEDTSKFDCAYFDAKRLEKIIKLAVFWGCAVGIPLCCICCCACIWMVDKKK